jgi:hypothetical protein
MTRKHDNRSATRSPSCFEGRFVGSRVYTAGESREDCDACFRESCRQAMRFSQSFLRCLTSADHGHGVGIIRTKHSPVHQKRR